MRIKGYILTLILLATVSSAICAQSEGQVENILMLKGGWNSMGDQYLSPMLYRGWGLGIGNEWWGTIREHRNEPATGRWQYVGILDINGQIETSAAKSNKFYSLGINGGWGVHYQWTFNTTPCQVKLWVGPYMEIDMRARNHVSNVNKPYSMDLAADIDAMGGVDVSFAAPKTSYRLRYMLRTNLLGVQFVPDYWQSYYEFTERVGLKGNFHCAYPGNRHHIAHSLSLDMQFKRSTWRVGVEHNYLKYGTKNLTFMRNELALVVGCIWQYKINGKVIMREAQP